jgi:hypothetical protein
MLSSVIRAATLMPSWISEELSLSRRDGERKQPRLQDETGTNNNYGLLILRYLPMFEAGAED